MRPVRTLNPGRLWRLDALGCLRTSRSGPARASTPLTGRQVTAMSSAMVTSAGTVGHGCDERRKAHSRDPARLRATNAVCLPRRLEALFHHMVADPIGSIVVVPGCAPRRDARLRGRFKVSG